METLESYDSIGKYLHDRREDLQGTGEWFTTFDVEKKVQISQSYASRVETGRIDHIIKKWPPDQQLSLLQAYKLDESSIVRVSKHFDLFAHYLLNQNTEGESIPVVGEVSGKDYADAVRIPKPSNLLSKTCFAKELTHNSLVSQSARPFLPPKATVFFDTNSKLGIKKGDLVLYYDEVSGEEFISVESNDYHVIDGKPPKVIKADAKLKAFGIYLGHIFLK